MPTPAGHYDALVAAWSALPQPSSDTDTATVLSNLATLNARTVPGPARDVSAAEVVGELALDGSLLAIEAYAAAPPAGANAVAVAGAKLLTQIAMNQSPITSFRMSDPTTAAKLAAMLDAMVADATSGLTAANRDAVVALSQTTLPWRNAPVASGGAGLTGSRINAWDLVGAGLISEALGEASEVAAQQG